MSEEIVLPRSGVRLRSEGGSSMFFRPPGINAAVFCPTRSSLKPTAAFGGGSFAGDTDDECIAWLDARVLALRAALLPADARERVTKAIYTAENGGPPWDEIPATASRPTLVHRAWCEARADAVLAALNGEGGAK